MEKVDIRSRSSQAKSLGTIITVSGAFIVTLYKGPILFFPNNTSPDSSTHSGLLNPFILKQSKWILGGLFLALGYLFVATWSVLQVLN